MSNPKDKANELYSKYDDLLNKDFGNPIVFDNQIKQCALIAVDEIIEALEEHQWQNRHIIDNYKLVKHEIENL
jgi:hypothetical protein